jgi:hypothetical protein
MIVAIASGLSASSTNTMLFSGRVAQRESARFTRERSLVRNQPCPLPEVPARTGLRAPNEPVPKPGSGGSQAACCPNAAQTRRCGAARPHVEGIAGRQLGVRWSTACSPHPRFRSTRPASRKSLVASSSCSASGRCQTTRRSSTPPKSPAASTSTAHGSTPTRRNSAQFAWVKGRGRGCALTCASSQKRSPRHLRLSPPLPLRRRRSAGGGRRLVMPSCPSTAHAEAGPRRVARRSGSGLCEPLLRRRDGKAA